MNLIRRLDDTKLDDALRRIEQLERGLTLMAKMVNRLSGGYRTPFVERMEAENRQFADELKSELKEAITVRELADCLLDPIPEWLREDDE